MVDGSFNQVDKMIGWAFIYCDATGIPFFTDLGSVYGNSAQEAERWFLVFFTDCQA